MKNPRYDHPAVSYRGFRYITISVYSKKKKKDDTDWHYTGKVPIYLKKQNNNPKTKKNIYTGSSGSLVLYGCDLIYY